MRKASFYRKACNLEDMRARTKEEVLGLIKPIFTEKTTQASIDEFMKSNVANAWQEEPKAEKFIVTKIIELNEQEYDKFANDFFENQSFIKENTDYMKYENGTWHCLAVTNPNREYAILVESEGYGYARYTAKVSKGDIK